VLKQTETNVIKSDVQGHRKGFITIIKVLASREVVKALLYPLIAVAVIGCVLGARPNPHAFIHYAFASLVCKASQSALIYIRLSIRDKDNIHFFIYKMV
jgi:hypothetical protein